MKRYYDEDAIEVKFSSRPSKKLTFMKTQIDNNGRSYKTVHKEMSAELMRDDPGFIPELYANGTIVATPHTILAAAAGSGKSLPAIITATHYHASLGLGKFAVEKSQRAIPSTILTSINANNRLLIHNRDKKEKPNSSADNMKPIFNTSHAMMMSDMVVHESSLIPPMALLADSLLLQWSDYLKTQTKLRHLIVTDVYGLKHFRDCISQESGRAKLCADYDFILVKHGNCVNLELDDVIFSTMVPPSKAASVSIAKFIENAMKCMGVYTSCFIQDDPDKYDTGVNRSYPPVMPCLRMITLTATIDPSATDGLQYCMSLADGALTLAYANNYNNRLMEMVQHWFYNRIVTEPGVIESTPIPATTYLSWLAKNPNRVQQAVVAGLAALSGNAERVNELLHAGAITEAAELCDCVYRDPNQIVKKMLKDQYVRFANAIYFMKGIQSVAKHNAGLPDTLLQVNARATIRMIAHLLDCFKNGVYDLVTVPKPDQPIVKMDISDFLNMHLKVKFANMHETCKEFMANTRKTYDEIKNVISRVKDNLNGGACCVCTIEFKNNDNANASIFSCCSAVTCSSCAFANRNLDKKNNTLTLRCPKCRQTIGIQGLVTVGFNMESTDFEKDMLEKSRDINAFVSEMREEEGPELKADEITLPQLTKEEYLLVLAMNTMKNLQHNRAARSALGLNVGQLLPREAVPDVDAVAADAAAAATAVDGAAMTGTVPELHSIITDTHTRLVMSNAGFANAGIDGAVGVDDVGDVADAGNAGTVNSYMDASDAVIHRDLQTKMERARINTKPESVQKLINEETKSIRTIEHHLEQIQARFKNVYDVEAKEIAFAKYHQYIGTIGAPLTTDLTGVIQGNADCAGEPVLPGEESMLVFCEHSEFLNKVSALFKSAEVPHLILGGSPTQIAAQTKAYRDGVVRILLINGSRFSNGLNLQNTSLLVMTHFIISTDLRNQIIARMVRMGATRQQRVLFLLHEEETQYDFFRKQR